MFPGYLYSKKNSKPSYYNTVLGRFDRAVSFGHDRDYSLAMADDWESQVRAYNSVPFFAMREGRARCADEAHLESSLAFSNGVPNTALMMVVTGSRTPPM